MDSHLIEVNYVKNVLSGSQILKGSKVVFLSSKHDDALMAGIDKLLVGDDRYFVMDRRGNKLIAFNDKGEFVASTSCYVGQGPDSYVRIIDAIIDNVTQKVYAHCDAPYCIMIFDMNLRLLEKISLDYYMREIADDEKYIYGIRMKNTPDFGYELVALDKSNLSAIPTVMLENTEVINGAMAIGRSLTSCGQSIDVCLPFDDTIYQIKSKEIIKCFPLDLGINGVDYLDIKGMTANELYASSYGKKIWSLVNVYSSDSTLFFSCNREYSFVMNRRTGVCDGYSFYRNDLFPYSSTQTLPVDGLDATFVYAWPSSYVVAYKKHVSEKYQDAEMAKILEGYDEEDNPLIVLCEIK